MNKLIVSLIAIVISSVLTENYVLRQAWYLPLPGCFQQNENAVEMSLGVVMTMATAVTQAIQKYLWQAES